MTREKLDQILNQHKIWLESAGVGGARAGFGATDLVHIHLQGANLSKADFWCANLKGANLSGADLTDASCINANLKGADLSNVDLRDANLQGADLRGAKLDQGIVEAYSIQGAYFTSDVLPWLILRKNWQNEREHVHIHVR